MVIEAGSVVEGKVSRITNFGAFIEIEGGKVGLIHISEVAGVYVRDVHDFLKEGDKVTAKVVSVDERGKIALSLKQMPKQQEDSTEESSSQPQQRGFKSSRPARQEVRKPIRQLSPSFEDKLSKFLKDSDERLTDLKRKTDSKRGGRGSRRSD